jgi:Mn-dependent DtxR family transcriptional regulator
MSPPSYHDRAPLQHPPAGGGRTGSSASLEDRFRRRGSSYPSRDYLCLDCIVPDDCDPASLLCLWRTDRRRGRDESQFELLSAVAQLAVRRPVSVADIASLLGVAPSALGSQIARAVEASLLAQYVSSRSPGVRLTAPGRQRLAELRDDRPELELSAKQRACYHLLAAVRDLHALGRATASLLAHALHRRDRDVAANLRRLAGLALVTYDFGHVELTDAGRHLLATLRAYAVNLRPGPRILIRARGLHRVRVLTQAHVSRWERPAGSAPPPPRRPLMSPAPLKRSSSAFPARRRDPALAAKLTAIAEKAFEAGASVAYLIRDPQALIVRDGYDRPVDTRPAATVLVLPFPCRADGEPALEELWPGDVHPASG